MKVLCTNSNAVASVARADAVVATVDVTIPALVATVATADAAATVAAPLTSTILWRYSSRTTARSGRNL